MFVGFACPSGAFWMWPMCGVAKAWPATERVELCLIATAIDLREQIAGTHSPAIRQSRCA